MNDKDAIEKLESKLASGELAPDYHVRQAIVTRYAENHGGLQLVGGVLVAVVGFSLVGWMGGVGIGLIAAQHLMNWHKKRSQDWRAIDAGRYAHLLTPTEAKLYERTYGKGSLQAAKQGDYSHAGIEPDEAIPSGSAGAIDVPAEAVEDTAKKSEPPLDFLQSEIEALVAEDAAAPPEASAEESSDSRTPPPITTTAPGSTHIAAKADDRFAWAKDLLHYPAVLIWGAQGSGKTSFAAWLLHQRIAAGHSGRVFDPHASYGQWNGLKVIGSGMNFSACDIAMQDFIAKVKQEYQARSKQPDYKPTRETVLVDEFTQWAAMCSHSSDFFVTALSDIRKIKKCVIFISHDRSLAGLGGAKGFSQARDNGLAELHLQCIVDPTTGEPRPAMKGKLKIPGKAAIEVEISPEMNGSMDFTQAIGVEAASAIALDEQQRLRDRLEGLYRETPEMKSETKPEIISESGEMPKRPETPEVNREMPETVDGKQVSGSQDESISDFISRNETPETSHFDPDRVRRVLEMKRNEMNQTKIIAIEWGAKAGDNKLYKDAVTEYQAIIDRHWRQ